MHRCKTVLSLGLAAGVTYHLKNWLFAKGLMASHDLAFDTLMGIRKAFAAKLVKMPMGAIQTKGSGAYKKKHCGTMWSRLRF